VKKQIVSRSASNRMAREAVKLVVGWFSEGEIIAD